MIPEIDRPTATRLANEILGTAGAQVQPIDVGFANQNWRVTSGVGNYVLKIGPASSASKWAAGAQGMAVAAAVGVGVPTMVFSELIDGRCVRMLEWVEGLPARSLIGREQAQARLGDQLGQAVAALHRHGLDWFASRLDASAGTFPTWAAYVDHRIDQIQSRAAANAAPQPELIGRSATAVRGVLPGISGACRPVVCHRDLHADNLIVDRSGSLQAVIDWDMPEAWDAAGEWFKLETMLFADLPNVRASFETAYLSVHPHETHWQQRKWLVQMVENMNVLANAPNHSAEFTVSAIGRLDSLLGAND